MRDQHLYCTSQVQAQAQECAKGRNAVQGTPTKARGQTSYGNIGSSDMNGWCNKWGNMAVGLYSWLLVLPSPPGGDMGGVTGGPSDTADSSLGNVEVDTDEFDILT